MPPPPHSPARQPSPAPAPAAATAAAAPPPPPLATPFSLRVRTAQTVLAKFTAFLTLCLHSLLYHRGLYPPITFLTARAFNFPVHQSRHPGLCRWINDAVSSITLLLREGTLKRICVNVHAVKSHVLLEKWVFDVSELPAWGDDINDEAKEDSDDEGEGKGDGEKVEREKGKGKEKEKEKEKKQDRENENDEEEDDDDDDDDNDDDDDDETDEDELEQQEKEVNWIDVNENLRGALSRIASAAESLPSVPNGSIFTIAVELKDGASAPIGHPQPWIPSQRPRRSKAKKSTSRGNSKTTIPVRAVRAGPLFFECWVEKGNTPPTTQPQQSSNTKATTSALKHTATGTTTAAKATRTSKATSS